VHSEKLPHRHPPKARRIKSLLHVRASGSNLFEAVFVSGTTTESGAFPTESGPASWMAGLYSRIPESLSLLTSLTLGGKMTSWEEGYSIKLANWKETRKMILRGVVCGESTLRIFAQFQIQKSRSLSRSERGSDGATLLPNTFSMRVKETDSERD
jgi:hypothetical protein